MSISISKRGQKSVNTVLRPDLEAFFEASANIWHEHDNPGGVFPLNMAENKLCWPLLKEGIQKILAAREIPDWTANYTGIAGSEIFLDSMAEFLTRHLAKTEITSDKLVTSAGATAVLDLVSWVLCDEKEFAVFPAPSYPVYTQDIGNRSRVNRYDLVTVHDLDEASDGIKISTDDLDRALKEIRDMDGSLGMLVITRPDNPTGSIYSIDELRQISAWCLSNKVHLVINELYGLSLLNTEHPEIKDDYADDVQFESAFPLVKDLQSDYVHVIYGMSKDFSISGFRIGILYSENEQMLKAYRNLNAPHMISNPTQWMLSELLTNSAFVKDYISSNQRALTESYVVVIKTLKKCKLSYVPVRGGLFLWLDLSEFLEEGSPEGELKLWQRIYQNSGILLTPGEGFGHSKYGQFRLVFSFIDKNALEEAMKRLNQFVESERKRGTVGGFIKNILRRF